MSMLNCCDRCIEKFVQLIGSRVLATSLLMGIACLALATGCAKEESNGDDSQASTHTPPQTVAPKQDRLVGVWLGTASIDEAKLQGRLEQLAAGQRDGAKAQAKSFLSTTMAIQYNEDGSVENDLEMVSVDGRLLRDGSTGTWNVVESRDDGLLIETKEILSDGTTATGRFDYQFIEDGKFVVDVPVSEILQGCDATLVFQRQTLSPINVAEAVQQTQTK